MYLLSEVRGLAADPSERRSLELLLLQLLHRLHSLHWHYKLWKYPTNQGFPSETDPDAPNKKYHFAL